MIRRLSGTSFASSVSTKLFILTFLSVVIAFLLTAFFGYQRLFEPIRQNNEKTLQGSVVQVENYIKTLMNVLQSQLLFLSNPVLYDKLEESDYVRLFDDMMTYHQDQIHSIYLIENDKVRISAPYGYRFVMAPGRIGEIRSQTAAPGIWWSAPYQIGERAIITVAKRIDRNRVVALDLDLSTLTGPQIVQNEPRRIYLFTGDGEYLSTNTYLAHPKTYLDHLEMKEKLAAIARTGSNAYSDVQTSHGSYAVLSSNQNRWDWVVFSVIEESQAFPLLETLRRQALLIVLLAIVLAVIVSGWITSYIRKPVIQITRQFKAAARGDLDARIHLKRSDEFTLIAAGFNRMMGNLRSLFDDLREAEEKKRHHELKVLHSQIHPHFLNNTLNAVYCLGETGQTKDMCDMIQFLMGLLQYSTDKVGDIVTVEDELRQLEGYARIMELRYGAVFEMDVAVPADYYQAPIPKLTLITLVENSIFYGLGQPDVNHIIVTAMRKETGGVLIEVSDTGPGIDPGKLRALMEEGDAQSPYRGLNNLGLRSVQERLRMTFGYPHGLHFQMEPEGGLRVTVHLPEYGPERQNGGQRGEQDVEAADGR
ncbi:cache domain-containing sensor histidine kinase [Paenibacillus methanolicus]|uniref:Histidine kinase/DNA gyrase B/HSP90-like ATPase n=1 Tax=Paenibacillus methanolicus TaxID=582686 RepID=A0A5S5CEE3_9BACL|nr:histidine kinase [Paenibacillus methanolicus]TYP76383.1 histidine kinase/DNA gyrase B/HSP90-like ATPase [Paenibacillus methanolicus]